MYVLGDLALKRLKIELKFGCALCGVPQEMEERKFVSLTVYSLVTRVLLLQAWTTDTRQARARVERRGDRRSGCASLCMTHGMTARPNCCVCLSLYSQKSVETSNLSSLLSLARSLVQTVQSRPASTCPPAASHFFYKGWYPATRLVTCLCKTRDGARTPTSHLSHPPPIPRRRAQIGACSRDPNQELPANLPA